MESGDKSLRLLCCAYWPLGLDSDDWGVRHGCLSDSGGFLRAKSGNMPFLVALKTESALDSLSFFFVCECGACPSVSNVHSVQVLVI